MVCLRRRLSRPVHWSARNGLPLRRRVAPVRARRETDTFAYLLSSLVLSCRVLSRCGFLVSYVSFKGSLQVVRQRHSSLDLLSRVCGYSRLALNYLDLALLFVCARSPLR